MRVLIVEDEDRLAAHLKQGLEEHAYAVDLAADGQTALDLAMVTDYDAVVLDLMLPVRDGAQVCAELRRRSNKAPILILTASSAVDEKVRLLDLGADDYLTKPFAFNELLARLRALLRRGPVERQNLLRVADLELDPAGRRVRRCEQDIVLTQREFAVLEYLMRNSGNVVTRAMIAGHVWDLDYEGTSNIVEVYINYLRRKVDQGFETKLIQTIRGVGYSIRSPE
ncbi:MAG: response regulator transcription factor [Acidobacteriota bacterium]